MIKLTWKQLNETDFVSTMVKLNNSDKLDSVTAYRVGRICQTAGKEMEKARVIEENLRNQALKKDETGKVLINPESKQPEWISDEAMKKFAEQFEKTLNEHVVEIKVHKLDFKQLSGLSGRELIAIEEIVDGLPLEF